MASRQPLSPSFAGAIRELGEHERRLFAEHMLRLDATARRDRFNGITDDAFVAAYAARCFGDGSLVIALVEDGAVRGAAELHERSPGDREAAEIAFSVEAGYRNRGLGGALFERLIGRARTLGYGELHVTTHPRNEAMKALARRFGAKLCFERYEAVGVIDIRREAEPIALPGAAEPRPAVHPAAAFAGLARAVAEFNGAVLGLRRRQAGDDTR